MKKNTISRFAKTALQVSKRTKRCVRVEEQDEQGRYFIACDYFCLRTTDHFTYDAICAKIGAENISRSGDLEHGLRHILYNNKPAEPVIRTTISAECPSGYKRFLSGANFLLAVNESYLDVFRDESDYTHLLGTGPLDPLIIKGPRYTAFILPIRTQVDDRAYCDMRDILLRTGKEA